MTAELRDADDQNTIISVDVSPLDGYYFLEAPGAGDYRARLLNSQEHNLVTSELIVLEKDEFSQWDYGNLAPADPVVEGYVSHQGEGIGRVVAKIYKRNGKLFATTTTNADG